MPVMKHENDSSSVDSTVCYNQRILVYFLVLEINHFSQLIFSKEAVRLLVNLGKAEDNNQNNNQINKNFPFFLIFKKIRNSCNPKSSQQRNIRKGVYKMICQG